MESPVPQNARSIAKNIAYGGMTWILPVALSLIATPVIVGSLGVEVYGIYALILGLIGYSFSFGIGRALTKYIAEYRISGQSDKIRELLSATLFLGLAAGLAGVIILFISANTLVSDVLQIPSASQRSTVLAVYIASVVILVSIFNQIFGAVLQGAHRFDLYSKLYNLGSIALMSGNLLLAWCGFGVTTLLIWNLVIVLISTCVFAAFSRRFLPEFVVGPRFSWSTIRLIGGYSASVVGYQLVTNALLLFERAWLTRKLGTESVGYYVVAATPGLYMQSFVASLVLMIVPLASEKMAKTDEMLPMYQKATRLIVLMTMFVVLILSIGGSSFLSLWMGDDFSVRATGLLEIHIVSFAIPTILTVSWYMKEGMGVPRFNFIAATISVLVGIPLMVVLSAQWGSEGVASARLIAFGLMSLSLIHFEFWAFDRLQYSFWLRIGFLGVLCSAFAGIAQWLVLNSFEMNWLAFCLSVAAAGAIFLVCAWVVRLISDEEKGQILRLLKIG